jgi:hypothetical protein
MDLADYDGLDLSKFPALVVGRLWDRYAITVDELVRMEPKARTTVTDIGHGWFLVAIGTFELGALSIQSLSWDAGAGIVN